MLKYHLIASIEYTNLKVKILTVKIIFIFFDFPLVIFFYLLQYSNPSKLCGSSSFGRASAFQAEGSEFEPRLPLHVDFFSLFGEMSEWLKEADCKSARSCVRWFESVSHHFFFLQLTFFTFHIIIHFLFIIVIIEQLDILQTNISHIILFFGYER